MKPVQADCAPGLGQQDICDCFNQLFGDSHRVLLQGGGAEPDYLPATPDRPALIIARADFVASALHEAAHWCVASRTRRLLPDYGYTYSPPPRDPVGQARFFAVERRAQAVEWYLSRRAGLAFRASADDPDVCLLALEQFQNQLWPLVVSWEQDSQIEKAPLRALQFGQALLQWRSREP